MIEDIGKPKIRDLFDKYVAKTSPFYMGLEVNEASGCYIYGRRKNDLHEIKFLDFISGISVNNLGHCNPGIVNAIKEQSEKYLHSHVYGEHIQEQQALYARDIANEFSEGHQVFFTNSGTEANELALKMARKITGREVFLALRGGFHGRTFGSLSVSWNDKYREGFGELLSCRFINRNSYNDLENVYWKAYAAIIVELVQGEAGTYPLDEKWFSDLCSEANKYGCLVIVDEVQTGFGRTGELFAQDWYNYGDITTLGKAMGGGLPLGGVIAKRELFEELQTPPFSHVTTFGGNPVSCAAGRAMYQQIDGKLLYNVNERAEQLEKGLKDIVDKWTFVKEQRGLGLMRTLEFSTSSDTEKFVERCLNKGLLVGFKLNNPTCVRISPPLIVTEKEVESALDIMSCSLTK